MGIRMLNHRPTVTRAVVGTVPAAPLPSLPAVSEDASTARIPTDLAATLRRTTAALRRRLVPAAPGRTPPPWRLWADVARGYGALLLTRLPRPGPVGPAGTVTVFVVAAPAVSGGSAAAAPHPSRQQASRARRPRRRKGRGPEPDATA
ncbi:hypothetical protein [Streptomyces tropicalis]|uniref:Uncharacterized protein n=1 Tax=Streptomyces tropicalis TaxID=3034234 RepID=A0ABT6ABW9_9ACTN|nr:hypothetical protein [Streptomyces tropicalis]MDF3301953.1 hypothetical protein [Streptomyces tropicalis]